MKTDNNEPSNVVSFVKKTQSPNFDLNQNKRALFADWLQLGTVMLVLDARKEGVKVPDEFKNQGDLRLNFDYAFHIADFNFNEVGVWATLAFDAGETFCMLPWECVYGIQSLAIQEIALWHQDIPADCQDEVLGYEIKPRLSLKRDARDNLLEQSEKQETSEVINNVISVDFANKSSRLNS